MDEQFLHYVWKFQKFKNLPLKTTDGEEIVVFNPGIHNHDAGPDFNEAKVKIGSLEWAGQVEIHLKSVDWLRHQHQHDPKYNNVILHVVWHHNSTIKVQGQPIPTLEIGRIVEDEVLENYKRLSGDLGEIPCSDYLSEIEEFKVHSTLTRMVSERLENKGREIIEPLLLKFVNDWEQIAFIMLARSFGMKINSDPLEILARNLPINILLKHQNSTSQIEALLFGTAGFLDGLQVDEYHGQLKKEYAFLKHKYEIPSILKRANWKFSKLRPANFPSVRLAQLSTIIAHARGIFSWMVTAQHLQDVRKRLSTEVSDYWKSHYDFGKEGDIQPVGETTINSIIINGLVPVIAKYGHHHGDEELLDKALSWLDQTAPENNKITRKWRQVLPKQKNAFGTQGQIHLFNEYCLKRRCLQCEIGSAIVGR